MQSLSPSNNWCTQDKPDAVVVAKMYLELLEINDAAELQTMDLGKLLATHQVLVRLFPPDWAHLHFPSEHRGCWPEGEDRSSWVQAQIYKKWLKSVLSLSPKPI